MVGARLVDEQNKNNPPPPINHPQPSHNIFTIKGPLGYLNAIMADWKGEGDVGEILTFEVEDGMAFIISSKRGSG
jgi:hypothetical protein